MTHPTSEQRAAAQALLGKVVRFNHMDEPWGKVIRVTHDNMVEVYGHGGYFAPHLFQIVEDHECDMVDAVEGPDVVGKVCSICGAEKDYSDD